MSIHDTNLLFKKIKKKKHDKLTCMRITIELG